MEKTTLIHPRPAAPILRSEWVEKDRDRIIEMAWEDRTPFEAIQFQFGLSEKEVIEFMRANSKPSSFRMWRKRMASRKTKHAVIRYQKDSAMIHRAIYKLELFFKLLLLTPFATILHFIPAALPFFAPSKWASTGFANFFR